MNGLRYAGRSLEAGLLAGVAVAAFFFVTDLARITPLSTPNALAAAVLPQIENGSDFVAIASTFAAVQYGGRLFAFSLLHLAVFSVLGLGFGLGARRLGVRTGLLTGAAYGVVVCSLVFLAGALLARGPVLTAVPSLGSVAAANALAGLVMGGFLRARERAVEPEVRGA